MSMGSTEGLTIDRIDNDGHYEPGNLRMVPMSVQGWNKQGIRKIVINGEERAFTKWIREVNPNINPTYAWKLHVEEGLSAKELAEYEPKDVGRRAQNLRLAELRTSA